MTTRLQFPFIEEALKLFSPEIVNKAQRLTITTMKGKAKTRISQAVRRKFNITNQRLSQALRMRTIDRGELRSAELDYVGTRIGLIHFGASIRRVKTTGKRGHLKGVRIRREGAAAKVSKERRKALHEGAFIAAGKNANVQVFQRIDQSDPKSKLRKVTGPAIPQMVGQEEVIQAFNDLVDTEFPNVFESKINYVLSRSG